MKPALSIALLLTVAMITIPASEPVTLSVEANEPITPYIEADQLSYCVPALDFPRESCAGMYAAPVEVDGRVIFPVPFPASSHHFTRDFVSESWVIEE